MSTKQKIIELLQDNEIKKLQLVQALWSNYGELSRYYSHKLAQNVIVKAISIPGQPIHAKGWATNASHQRKIRSYQVELHFYQYYQRHPDPYCYTPALLAHSEMSVGSQHQLLIIEDLHEAGYRKSVSEPNSSQLNAVIKWLAYFHAKYLNTDGKQLWEKGTYWHLATRNDELQAMESGQLKSQATVIDNTLNNANYQTLVHGDAKVANFCFDDDTGRVAAVDFQYVGKGVGVKDLQYFLGSCLTEPQLFDLHDQLLDEYFSQLKLALEHYQQPCDANALEREWRTLYTYACADFHRFLKGWNPDHPKLNKYLTEQTNLVLNKPV